MSDWFPTRDEALEILRNEGCSEEVITHCLAVESLALKIAERCDCEIPLVTAGALLHDVGRSVTHDIWHAVRGVEILERLGVDGRVVKIVERHIGAGLTVAEASGLGLPAKDYVPLALEEKIVAHADNLIGNTEDATVRFSVDIGVEELKKRGLGMAADKILALHEELSGLCGIDIDRL